MEILFILLGLLSTSAAVSMFGSGAAGNASGDATPTDTPDDPSGPQTSGVYHGGSGDNEIHAGGDATITGGKGADSIWAGEDAFANGGTGQDIITLSGDATGYGGWGDDTLKAWGTSAANGDVGDDVLTIGIEATGHGGVGNDTLTAAGNAWGDDGDDTLILTPFHSPSALLYGGAGSDTLVTTAGATGIAYGGAGGDGLTIDARAQGFGGAGNDTFTASGASWGDDGDDRFDIAVTGLSPLSFYGGAGGDTMSGVGNYDAPIGSGLSSLYGGLGDDRILADEMVAYGDDGNDTISNAFSGGGSADSVFGGIGNDSLSGDTTHYGGEGDDTISAEMGRGYGDAGNDIIAARFGYGGAGDDVLTTLPLIGEGGVTGNSEVYGGDGDDTLWGYGLATYEAGPAMVLSGGAGNDVIHSEGGDNVDAGAGKDTVFAYTADLAETSSITLGGGADDLFLALAPDVADEKPTITVQDFDPASDHLALIVAAANAASVQYTITPNLAGGNTLLTITAPGSTVITYDFKGITSLDASAIKLYASEAAVTTGTSYGNLA